MFQWLSEFYHIRLNYLEQRAILKEVDLRNKTQFREDEVRLEEEQNACLTCDVLKLELAKAHDENRRLIDLLTTKPAEPAAPSFENLKPILPSRHMPFSARRQILQEEDRAAARVIRDAANAAKEDAKSDLTATLERELQIVESEREAESGVRE